MNPLSEEGRSRARINNARNAAVKRAEEAKGSPLTTKERKIAIQLFNDGLRCASQYC